MIEKIAMTTDIKLIVGLGNPDARYAHTRHNVGFGVVERLARDAHGSWADAGHGAHAQEAVLPGGQRLLKPLEFMNNSGRAVRTLMEYYRIQPSEILVVVDDFSLTLGILRARVSGSAGGHNGLKSIIEQLGTAEFPRLRCGIGPVPPNWDPADYVLSKFLSEESPAVEDMIQRAAAAVTDMLRDGLAKTAGKGLNS